MRKIPTRAAEHPEHVWEAQRKLFTRLYKEEGMKLPEVQRLMQDEHRFYATERQYKRRIKKWKLEKNSKADEKTHALALLQGSETQLDLACVYKLNGKDIAARKLLRHARSRGIEPPNIVCKDVDRKCRSSLRCTERITRSQDFDPYYSSRFVTTFVINPFEVLVSSSSFLYSGEKTLLNDLPSVQFQLSLRAKYFKQTMLHFADAHFWVNRLLKMLLSLKHLKSRKQCAIWRELIEVVYSVFTLDFSLGRSACQTLLPPDIINTNKTREEWFDILVDKLEVLYSELISKAVDKRSAELPRAIEIVVKFPNHQRKVQSEALEIEMQDIDYTDTSNTTTHSSRIIQSFEISDNPEPAKNSSEIHFHNHLNAGDLPRNGFEVPKVAPRSSSDGASELKDNKTSQNLHHVASVETDSYVFGLTDPWLAGLPPSPPFPSVLTMELPPPLVLPDEYMHLTWRFFDSSEIQEGPTPDLETFLDSSLWEYSWDMSQLNQNSVPPLELVDEGATSPPPTGVQKHLQ